jgi:3-hydroxyacyl-CoA dehydrogenase
MGSGIALVCAQHGFTTLLFDVNQQALVRHLPVSLIAKLLVNKQRYLEKKQ